MQFVIKCNTVSSYHTVTFKLSFIIDIKGLCYNVKYVFYDFFLPDSK